MDWKTASLIASISNAIAILLSKHLLNTLPAQKFLALVFAIEAVAFTIYARGDLAVKKEEFLTIIILAICCFITNLFAQVAIKDSPNPSYYSAILTSGLILLAFSSHIIFGSELTIKGLLGISLIVIGVVLLTI